MQNSMIQATEQVRGVHALSALRSGRQALSEIAGLHGQMIRGLLINYAIFVLAALVLNGLFYFYALAPFIDWVFGGGEGFLAATGTMVLWLIQLTAAAVFAMVALRFSIELASLWHQSLVIQVIRHFREIEELPFSLEAWWSGMKVALREALKACVFPLLLLLLGLIPLIGVVLVMVVQAHLMGREVVNVYLDGLSAPDDAVALRQTWRWVPLRLGWLPMGLAFVPLLGWLLLPFVLTCEVVGFTYQVESSRASK